METVRKVVLVGARGQMGSLLRRKMEEKSHLVVPLDKPLDKRDIPGTLTQADLVLISVPIPAMDAVLDQIVPHLDPGTILADICSVKVNPLTRMLKKYQGPVVGTHPLFGPVPPEDEQLRVAICPGRDDQAADVVEHFFQNLSYATFRTSAADHDRAMAYIQGLNFVTTVSYLSSMPQDLDMESFLTPSFRRRLESAHKMITQDADLFATLFEQNPYSSDSVRGFRSFLNVAAGGDLDLVTQKALWWWRDHIEKGGH